MCRSLDGADSTTNKHDTKLHKQKIRVFIFPFRFLPVSLSLYIIKSENHTKSAKEHKHTQRADTTWRIFKEARASMEANDIKICFFCSTNSCLIRSDVIIIVVTIFVTLQKSINNIFTWIIKKKSSYLLSSLWEWRENVSNLPSVTDYWINLRGELLNAYNSQVWSEAAAAKASILYIFSQLETIIFTHSYGNCWMKMEYNIRKKIERRDIYSRARRKE